MAALARALGTVFSTSATARLASRKHGLRGINWLDCFAWTWLGDLGIYRLIGTVRYWSAHA